MLKEKLRLYEDDEEKISDLDEDTDLEEEEEEEEIKEGTEETEETEGEWDQNIE